MPIGYGWGYRSWGPPYPRYLQNRRHRKMLAANTEISERHLSWGWGGDFIWVISTIWLFGAILYFLGRA